MSWTEWQSEWEIAKIDRLGTARWTIERGRRARGSLGPNNRHAVSRRCCLGSCLLTVWKPRFVLTMMGTAITFIVLDQSTGFMTMSGLEIVLANRPRQDFWLSPGYSSRMDLLAPTEVSIPFLRYSAKPCTGQKPLR